MVFNKNIPQPNDQLSASQIVLLTNNQDLDTSFGVDHFEFSNATANNGKHKTVTTPNGAIPATTADPKIYGYEKTANLGTLQFSRGINDRVPTPLTSINSAEADRGFLPGGDKIILDCTGMDRTVMTITIQTLAPDSVRFAIYSASVSNEVLAEPILVFPNSAFAALSIFKDGNLLKAKNNLLIALSHVYWTIQFLRIE